MVTAGRDVISGSHRSAAELDLSESLNGANESARRGTADGWALVRRDPWGFGQQSMCIDHGAMEMQTSVQSHSTPYVMAANLFAAYHYTTPN
jgi:hypothetical protein